MGSNFTAIGVREDNIDSFIGNALERGEPVPAGKGMTFRWQGDDGAGICVHLDKRERVECVTPTFRPDEQVGVQFDAYLPDSECAFCSCIQVALMEDGELVFPFNVQLADAVAVRDYLPEPGTSIDLELAFFGHEVTLHADEDAFSKHQQDEELKFASESFIPAGMFGGAPSSAWINGKVRSGERRTNSSTGQYYYYVRVDTLGFTADVVLDPDDVHRLPSPGNILSGEYWGCARVATGLRETPRRKSLVRRVLGG